MSRAVITHGVDGCRYTGELSPDGASVTISRQSECRTDSFTFARLGEKILDPFDRLPRDVLRHVERAFLKPPPERKPFLVNTIEVDYFETPRRHHAVGLESGRDRVVDVTVRLTTTEAHLAEVYAMLGLRR